MNKNKSNTDSSNIPKRDAFMRLNFIYQAAHVMMKSNPNNAKLIQHYGTVFKSISRKNVIRVSPDIKRNWCKRCNLLMMSGVTSTVRFKAGKNKKQVIKCLNCDTCKKFPINPNYQLWYEHEKSEPTMPPKPANTNNQQSKKQPKIKTSVDNKISKNENSQMDASSINASSINTSSIDASPN